MKKPKNTPPKKPDYPLLEMSYLATSILGDDSKSDTPTAKNNLNIKDISASPRYKTNMKITRDGLNVLPATRRSGLVPMPKPPKKKPQICDALLIQSSGSEIPPETNEKKEEDIKIPWFTVACLAILCVLSIGTGAFYWYRTYYTPTRQTADVAADIVDVVDIPSPPTALIPYNPTMQELEIYAEHDPISPFSRIPLDPRPEFIALWEAFGNPDIVGHLYIEGTDFETYVVQGADNEFYTSHDIYKNPSGTGWVFLDYMVDIYLDMDVNVVIHGYNGSYLQRILTQYFYYDFFLAHPVISFDTKFANYNWEIFAFYVAPKEFPFAQVYHPLDVWGERVEMFTLASLYNTRLDVTEYDQVLTIVTPTSTTPGLYYVLQARLYRYITS